jgi:hypothetical protein
MSELEEWKPDEIPQGYHDGIKLCRPEAQLFLDITKLISIFHLIIH